MWYAFYIITFDLKNSFYERITLCYNYDKYMILILVLPICTPFLEEACEAVAKKMGRTFQKGKWSGVYGCYYYKTGKYAKNVYFSDKGTVLNKSKTHVASNKYRPKGYDCKTGNLKYL